MSNIFDKWNKEIDGEALAKDVKEVEANGGTGGDYSEVPFGQYEVRIDKMELKSAKSSGNPMISIWFKILAGDFKNSFIFMNQVITQGFQIHIMNEFLRSLDTDVDVKYDGNYSHYNDIILDVHEQLDGKLEYVLDYGKNDKGFNTFKIVEIFEVE